MSTITEVRAFLDCFARSPWRDVYVRSGDWTVFFAKPGGGANPARHLAAVDDAATVDVVAPHLGLFFGQVSIGRNVRQGDLLGQVEVLGEPTEVIAPITGRVDEVLPDYGALVEFGTCLVRVIPA